MGMQAQSFDAFRFAFSETLSGPPRSTESEKKKTNKQTETTCQTPPKLVDTEYDRANVPPYNGNDPPPAPGSLKRSLFPTLLNEVQNKGTQGVRRGTSSNHFSIVRYPGRPVISVPELGNAGISGPKLPGISGPNLRLGVIIQGPIWGQNKSL